MIAGLFRTFGMLNFDIFKEQFFLRSSLLQFCDCLKCMKCNVINILWSLYFLVGSKYGTKDFPTPTKQKSFFIISVFFWFLDNFLAIVSIFVQKANKTTFKAVKVIRRLRGYFTFMLEIFLMFFKNNVCRLCPNVLR